MWGIKLTNQIPIIPTPADCRSIVDPQGRYCCTGATQRVSTIHINANDIMRGCPRRGYRVKLSSFPNQRIMRWRDSAFKSCLSCSEHVSSF